MNKDEVVTLLSELIKIPSFVTTEPGVNENKLVDYIESWLLKNTNLKIERQKLPGGRFNIIAKKGNPETIFLGHTDTVQPSKNAPIDQLSGKIIKNEIWGRGATDMKSGLAAIMSAAHLAKDAKNYWIIFYADEEYDFLGMKELVKKLNNLKPKMIVSADGSDLEIGHGCRGLIELTCRVYGETGHPAKGTGKSAIWGTIIALTKLKEYLTQFKHPQMGRTSFNLAYINGGAELPDSITNNYLRSVGRAGNVVPDICEFTIDIRPAIPELKAKNIIKFIKKELISQKLKFELVEQKHNLGAWYTNSQDIQSYRHIAKEITGSSDLSNPNSTGYLDLQMLWEATGKPLSFMFGGGIGSTAHKPNERIRINDLIKTRNFFLKIMLLKQS